MIQEHHGLATYLVHRLLVGREIAHTGYREGKVAEVFASVLAPEDAQIVETVLLQDCAPQSLELTRLILQRDGDVSGNDIIDRRTDLDHAVAVDRELRHISVIAG